MPKPKGGDHGGIYVVAQEHAGVLTVGISWVATTWGYLALEGPKGRVVLHLLAPTGGVNLLVEEPGEYSVSLHGPGRDGGLGDLLHDDDGKPAARTLKVALDNVTDARKP